MPNNNPIGGVQWSAEHCTELTRMAGLGMSYRAIAAALNEQFGTSYTRNATIGKAGRIGLSKEPAASIRYIDRKPRAPRAPREPRKRSEAIRIIPANGNSNAMRVVRTVVMEQARLRCVEIEPRHLSLTDMERGDCRYAYGDGPFTFCGHPVKAGSSYCEPHHELCWQPRRILTDRTWRRAA